MPVLDRGRRLGAVALVGALSALALVLPGAPAVSTPAATVSIEGTVTFPGGEPVVGAEVQVAPVGSPDWVQGSAEVGPDGTFIVEGLSPQTYYVQAISGTSLGVSTYAGAIADEPYGAWLVVGSAGLSGLDIVMPRGARLSGTFSGVAPDDYIFLSADRLGTPKLTSTNGYAGDEPFEWTMVVPPGDFRITSHARNLSWNGRTYVATYWSADQAGGALQLEDASTLTVAAGEEVAGLDMTTTLGNTLRGAVVLPPTIQGAPVEGWWVMLERNGAPFGVPTGFSDHGFSVDALPSGTYVVTLGATTYLDGSWSQHEYHSSPIVLAGAGETRSGIDFLRVAVPTFADVPAGSQFAGEITWLAAAGITTGWGTEPNRQYGPVTPVKRDAMAAFLYRLAGSPAFTPPATSTFLDVPTSNQFYKEISWLAAQGISTGWDVAGGKEFRPLANVARDAMAVFLYRYAESQMGTPMDNYVAPWTSPFADVPPSNVFYRQIAWLADSGISTGYGSGANRTFAPLNPVNRDAMAAFMYRMAV